MTHYEIGAEGLDAFTPEDVGKPKEAKKKRAEIKRKAIPVRPSLVVSVRNLWRRLRPRKPKAWSLREGAPAPAPRPPKKRWPPKKWLTERRRQLALWYWKARYRMSERTRYGLRLATSDLKQMFEGLNLLQQEFRASIKRSVTTWPRARAIRVRSYNWLMQAWQRAKLREEKIANWSMTYSKSEEDWWQGLYRLQVYLLKDSIPKWKGRLIQARQRVTLRKEKLLTWSTGFLHLRKEKTPEKQVEIPLSQTTPVQQVPASLVATMEEVVTPPLTAQPPEEVPAQTPPVTTPASTQPMDLPLNTQQVEEPKPKEVVEEEESIQKWLIAVFGTLLVVIVGLTGLAIYKSGGSLGTSTPVVVASIVALVVAILLAYALSIHIRNARTLKKAPKVVARVTTITPGTTQGTITATQTRGFKFPQLHINGTAIGIVVGAVIIAWVIVGLNNGRLAHAAVIAANNAFGRSAIVPVGLRSGSLSSLPWDTVRQPLADCESGKDGKPGTGKQFKEGTTTVVFHKNTNGTVDIGKWQINSSHLEEIPADIDIYTEEGNEQFARILYASEGLGPWESSRECWEPKLRGFGAEATSVEQLVLKKGEPARVSIPPGWRWDIAKPIPKGWTTDNGFLDSAQNRIQVFEVTEPTTEVRLTVNLTKCSTPQQCAW